MIIKNINERMIRAYVKSITDAKYAVLTYGTYVIGTMILASNPANAAEGTGGDVVKGVTKLIQDLRLAVVSVSTAAAIVGVGSGAFLKKFSIGKMDRIETGNKLITNSIWGWIMINGLTAILNWVGKYFGARA